MSRVASWLLAAAGYLALTIAVTWPLAARLDSALPGFPNVDAFDTVALRGIAAELIGRGGEGAPHSPMIFAPTGYPAGWMIPNWADHVTGMGLMRVLDFPASDGVWWLVVLSLNGLAGHRLGHQLGGSHGAGLLVGVGWAFSDSVLREANLHHAPQSMSFSTPLYLAALLRCTADDGRWRDGAAAGVWMAIAGITYWYGALFLAAASIPVVVARRLHGARRVALAAALSALLVAPALSSSLGQWSALPAQSAATGPVRGAPQIQTATNEHLELDQSSDLLLPLRTGPIDRSNWIPLALLAAAALSIRRDHRAALPLLGVAGIGYAMALGPYLTWDGAPVVVSDRLIPLPFRWLGELHPTLDRLNWPQRWGILIPLGLAAAAARAPKPALFAALIGAELLARSGNAPLQLHDLRHRAPWADLAAAEGAVLSIPLLREKSPSETALNARLHGRPTVNGIGLPPGHSVPAAWSAWAEGQPLVSALLRMERRLPADPPRGDALQAAAESLRGAGVAAVTLEIGPTSGISRGQRVRYHALLDPAFGLPDDRGAYLVWWVQPPAEPPPPLADPDDWRDATRAWIDAFEPPALDVGLGPVWPELGAPPRRAIPPGPGPGSPSPGSRSPSPPRAPSAAPP